VTAQAAVYGRHTSPLGPAPAALGRPVTAGPRARATANRRARRRAAAWSPACRRGQGPAAYRTRRPGDLAVWRVMPPGHRRAAHLGRWLDRVRDAALERFRTDAAERRVELAAILATHTDWASCTYRTGWALLADRAGVSRSTVARFLAWLREADLVAVVATGRVASLTRAMALTTPPPAAPGPAAGPAGSRSGGPGDAVERNDAAVYVLIEPTPAPRAVQVDPGLLATDPRWATGQLGVDRVGRAVDLTRRGPLAADEIDDTETSTTAPHGAGAGRPHPAGERTDTPYQSSEAGTQSAREPSCPRCSSPRGASLRDVEIDAPRQHQRTRARPGQPKPATTGSEHPIPMGPGSPGQPTEPCPACGPWPRRTPAATRADRLRLVHRLRRVAPDLVAVGSAPLLRHLLRPWLTADWTVDDVLLALDNHPQTGPRPHSPLTRTPTGPTRPGTPRTRRGAVRNPPGWLLSRMRDWTLPDGTPMPPHTQRTATNRATRLAAQHARRAVQHTPTGPPPPAWHTARAALRARTDRTAPPTLP